jgi:HEAT repeat protein
MSLYKPDVENLLKKRDVPMLMKALGDTDAQVRREAAGALGILSDTQAVEALIISLNDTDGSVCEAAAEALGEIGQARAVRPLIAALKGEHRVCCAAIRALGKLRDHRAVEPLAEYLSSQNEAICENAAKALGDIGDKQAVRFLMAAMAGCSPQLKEAYHQAIQHILGAPR